jgi:O-succinylbenzoate synthase
MKIVKMEIYEVILPMVRTFKTGFGNITNKSEVIVKLVTSEGLVGFGEAPTLKTPVYNHETTSSCLYNLEHFIWPRVANKKFETAEEFRASYNDVVGSPAAKAGIEGAFWHLLSQRDNVSLKKLFGGEKSRVAVGEGIGIKKTTKEVIDEARMYLEKGFMRLKIKIEPGWDIEPLTVVREQFPDIDLIADGNSAYQLDEHKDLLVSFEKFNLGMLEQPLAPDDFVDHAALQAATKTPICLDESIRSLNDTRTAIALKSCKIINIKPGRVGGILEAIAIHDEAAKNGIGVWVGGMLETGLGRAFNLALASKSNFIYSADMSPYELYYADDITSPGLKIDNGYIEVPDIPGLGFTINENKIKKYSKTTKLL